MSSPRADLLTNRRTLLSGLAGGFALLGGCSGLLGDNSTATQQPPPTTESSTNNGSETETAVSTSASTSTTDDTATQSADTTGSTQLRTYTNSTYGYRIKYPTRWSVDESTLKEVVLKSDSSNNLLRIKIIDQSGQRYTLSQIVDFAVSSTRDRMADVTVLDERDVTLSSGQSAHILEFRYDNPDDATGMIRSTYLVTLHGGLVYEVEFGHLGTSYTESVEQLATTLIDSFLLTGQRSTDQPPSTQSTDVSSDDSLDLSPLTTYTNVRDGYRIKYPADWAVSDGSRSAVTIVNPDSDVIRIVEIDLSGRSYTLSEVADLSVRRSRASMTDVEIADRQRTTLPSGQSAIILHGTYDAPNDAAGQLRTSLLLTIRQDTAYKVEFVADASDWTPTVERGVRRILTSFTLTDGTNV